MSFFWTARTYLQSCIAKRQNGLVAIEYVILAGLAVAAIIAAFAIFGVALQTRYDTLL
jgi:Flp pilus assembly pilin Flp